jgi:putative endonuclease
MNKRATGSIGESAACGALTKAGMTILERNWRRPTGEIDIIAKDRKTIVFVEVKTRSSLKFGRPAEAVGRSKQMHILRTAMLYLAENGLDDAPVRFDIVEVLPTGIRHLKNAFDATDMADF